MNYMGTNTYLFWMEIHSFLSERSGRVRINGTNRKSMAETCNFLAFSRVITIERFIGVGMRLKKDLIHDAGRIVMATE